MRNQVAELYWLGYLLTGDRERSIQAVVHTLDNSQAGEPLCGNRMLAWFRRMFIAKALGSAPGPTSTAELGTRLGCLQHGERRCLPRSMQSPAGKPELARALLAIDLFPRRALVLRVFEKLAFEEIGILLKADRESVKTAVAVGLIELARNLAIHAEPVQRTA